MRKQRLCLFMIFTMVFTMLAVTPLSSQAATTSYSMVVLNSGLDQPLNIIKGPDGKLYISEYDGGNIARVDITGQNKNNFATGLDQPIGMVFDNSGNLYVAPHYGNKVIKITPDGTQTSIKDGAGILTGLIKDSSNRLYAADYNAGKILRMNLDGSGSIEFVTGLGINRIIGMTIDSNDNLFVADFSAGKIRKITSSGTVSDFITGLYTPTWVTLGKDGFFYVSLGTKVINKYDTEGHLVGSFNTPTDLAYPWGTYIDEAGYIYYVAKGEGCHKIIGTAGTTDKQHIELTLNTTMAAITLDTNAFTVTGAASSPNVTSAVASGSSIKITLDNALSYTDTSIKVNYSKTGTNNLVVSGSAIELDNFTGLPISNNLLRINNIASIPNINVPQRTALSSVKAQLPASVITTLSNNTTESSSIVWDDGTPAYDSNTLGTYVFSGMVSTSSNVSNSSNLKASAAVIVSEAPLTNIASVAAQSNITVANGTALNAVGLPTRVNVNLDNATTSSVAVTWDSGTPVYNGTVAGTYVFSGDISLGYEFLNPSNMKASVQVIVGSAPSVPATNTNNTTVKDRETAAPSGSLSTNEILPLNDNTIIKINGTDQRIGTESTSVEAGLRKVSVSVNTETMNQVIDAAIKSNMSKPASPTNVVEVNVVDKTANIAVVGLTGEIVKKLDQNNFDVLIKKGSIAYKIPAKELTVDMVAKQLSVGQDRLKEIHFEIQMKELIKAQQSVFSDKLKANNSEILLTPVEFNITAKVQRTDSSTQDVSINAFTQYVERIIEVPNTLNPSEITTGIVFNQDQSYNHVPTNVFTKDGKYFAQINSLTNSTYAVIKNSVEVKGAKGHWSESTVNDMASRLILADIKDFKPDAQVTRAELAEYLTRALGLYREDYSKTSNFKDVKMADPHAKGITIANEWKLVSGYDDGSFKGNAIVTREETMTMFAKAMEIAKFTSTPGTSSNTVMNRKTSNWSRDAVQKVTVSKVFIGRTNGDQAPKDPITHAEVLSAIKNLLTGSQLINR